jgi:hypothetical protein
LAERGYLKETYDKSKGDLKHELTNLGKMELRDILKDPEMKREFLGCDDFPATEHHCPFDEILQFPDISRIGMAEEKSPRLF